MFNNVQELNELNSEMNKRRKALWNDTKNGIKNSDGNKKLEEYTNEPRQDNMGRCNNGHDN